MAFHEAADLGSFEDLVSAWSKDRTFFEVGVIEETSSKGVRKIDAAIYKFVEREGVPRLAAHARISDENTIEIKFSENRKFKYRVVVLNNKLSKSEPVGVALRRIFSDLKASKADFIESGKDLSAGLPIPFILDRVGKKSRKKGQFSFHDDIMDEFDLTWIAPIRTAPKQFYGGVRGTYSPEGEHTPFLLRKALDATDRSSEFVAKLDGFGKASGLFEAISTHTFGDDPRSPFELLIKFSGATLNINNVGYGVSQALPLVVEFLSRDTPGTFAVQQPEVHLHPRAQAALGGLVFELSHGQKQSFYIETHSDYLIDRFRIEMKASKASNLKGFAQVVFFSRSDDGNKAETILIANDGSFPLDQPKDFRDFFIREEMRLLDL
jgi:hypothetical protein